MAKDWLAAVQLILGCLRSKPRPASPGLAKCPGCKKPMPSLALIELELDVSGYSRTAFAHCCPHCNTTISIASFGGRN